MSDYPMCCGRAGRSFKTATLRVQAEDLETTKIDPLHHAIEGARSFAQQKGLGDPHEGIDYHRVMTHDNLIHELGRSYDKLPEFDPKAAPHFDAMRHEVGQQFHHLTHNMGIQVHVTDHDPYKDVHELAHDVRQNHRIQVMGTHVTGGHPYFTNHENDQFRAVHDVFGHLATGRGFDRHGEEAAFQAHSRMFSGHALPAMASETRGQNGSLITNGHFGPQRIALLPRHLWHPGLAHNASMVDDFRWEQDAQNKRAEQYGGGHKTETDSYFGRDGEGNGQEKRVNFKDWLKDRKGPEEVRPPHEEAYWTGHEMGSRHGEDPQHADFDELEHHHTDYPDHLMRGYMDGFKSMSHTWDKTGRIAVLSEPSRKYPVFKVFGHVSGNQVDILHCPFCGSGAVIGRSDGTVECGFCSSVFTVQVQPQYNGMPQSVDGQPYEWPGMPDPNEAAVAQPDLPDGTNLNPNTNGEADAAAGLDPNDPNAIAGTQPGGAGQAPPFQSSDPADGGEEGDEDGDDSGNPFAKGKGDDKKSDSKPDKKDDKKKGDNPFAKKKSYRTATGAELDEENYLAHLAIAFANDKTKVAEIVKNARRG